MDWLATSAAIRSFILAQQQETDPLLRQLTLLATELAILREQISRNSSKHPV